MNRHQLRMIQKEIEEIERHRRHLDLFGNHWRQIQELEKHRHLLDPFGDHWKLIRQMDAAGRHDLFRRRIEDATFARLLPDLSALKFGTAEWGTAARLAADRLQTDIISVEEKLRAIPGGINQAEVWKRQLSDVFNDRFRPSVIPQALSAGAVWHGEIERLANIVESHRLHVRSPDLASTLLRPSEYFTGYALGVTERLNDTENENDRAIFRGVLGLAEEEFSDAVSSTESLIQSESDIEIVAPDPPVIYTLYEEQEQELVRLVGSDGFSRIEFVPSIFDEMRTIELSRMAADAVRIVALCNQESQSRGGRDIFKPTNALIEAAVGLPFLIVKGKDELLSFVLYLYRLLYEGAGSDALRFLKKHGGHLEPEECGVIWVLKTLRNKLTTHDPEHGKESQVQKNYSDLGSALRSLGLTGMPVTETDYSALQKELLSQTNAFLLLLIGKMQAESAE
jgi:hypothetical protein